MRAIITTVILTGLAVGAGYYAGRVRDQQAVSRRDAVNEILDWNKLPPKLRYLIAPAEKYGYYQFEEKIIDFLRSMSEEDKRELIDLDRRYISDAHEIDAWVDAHSITHHPESRLVYFLGCLLAHANDGGFLSAPGK